MQENSSKLETKTKKSKSAPITASPDKDSAKESLTHFITAWVFLHLGLIALIFNSERLSQGAFLDGRVVGGIHWITLGWLSLSIFGALRVFMGVALGTQGFSLALVPWIRRLWVVGSLFLPLGLILNIQSAILLGAVSLGVALLLFTIHIVPALYNSKRGSLTRIFLGLAVGSILGAWLLGALAATVRAGHPVMMLPSGYFIAHILLTSFGWVGSTVVGVGIHLIPMFALSKDCSTLPIKIALPFWAAIPIFAVLGMFHSTTYFNMAFYCACAGSTLWICQVIIFLLNRIRKEQDPGLFLAAGATMLLILAWIYGGPFNDPICLIGTIIIGWLTLFTLGIYHRVIPFLVWFVRFSKNAGRGPVPKVKALMNDKIGMTTLILSISGAILWSVGLHLRQSILLYLGSTILWCGSLVATAQVWTLLKPVRSKHEAARSLLGLLTKEGKAASI